MGLTEYLFHIAAKLVALFGYGGLAFGLIVDSAGVPIPSEVLIPLAGGLVRQGVFNMVAVITVSTLAQTSGAILAYWLGARGGLALVKKYGKYVFFSEHELVKTQKLFDKYGALITLSGRCLPGIRTYIGYPAGVAKMPFGPFVIYSFIGSLVWTVFLAAFGYYFVDKLAAVDHFFSKFGLLILVGAAVAFWYYVKKSRAKTKSKSSDSESE